MQAHPYFGNARNTLANNRSLTTLLILVLFLLLGAGIGYLAANSAVKAATLNVEIANDTGVTQDIRIFVNNDEVALVRIADGGTATTPIRVGWTSPDNGMYEVRATPTMSGLSDTDRVVVSNGLTYVIALRVR